MSFNRVIVNDKGIKQEGQQWGTDHGLEIDMFEPGRVEIIKGPGSLMYGSDGIGGVLNIFPPALPEEGTVSGSLRALYKSNNQNFSNSAGIQGNKKGRVFRIRATAQDYGDYRVPANHFSYNGYKLNIANNRLKNTAGKERHFTAMAGIKKKWGYSVLTVSNFHQKAGFFVGAIGIPRSYLLSDDGDSRDIGLPYQKISHFKVISNNNFFGRKKLAGNRHWVSEQLPTRILQSACARKRPGAGRPSCAWVAATDLQLKLKIFYLPENRS